LKKKKYNLALELLSGLIIEIRKLDDKPLLVELNLLESKVYTSLKNYGKAKGSLTGARSAANSIYCPILLQSELDMQSGILHAEEKDYQTSFSYFFESFEGYHSLDDTNAIYCLKYMLLCKIMSNETDDINNILTSKNPLKYSKSDEIISVKEVATAYHNRSLFDFEKTLLNYKKELQEDSLINSHINELYDNLLEQHLIRIIEPFSRVQISHIAKLIGLDKSRIERKLSQMILDKKFLGILDQGNDCLEVFFEEKEEELYPLAIETIQNFNIVVESLFGTCQKLTQ